jgi:leader peptidase (prepilin peptidase) / N-methyltransferase
MDIFWGMWFFIIGMVLASFGGVVGYRLPKGKKISLERSECDHCSRKLNWLELIPVISFVAVRGKCRTCKGRILFIYSAAEMITGFLFAFSFLQYGFSKEMIVACSLVMLCAIIFVSDLLYYIISDKVLMFFSIWFIMLLLLLEYRSWVDTLGGALLGFFFLFLVAVISKGSVGGGDIKLMGVLGLVLGFQGAYLALVVAAISGAVVGTIGLVMRKYTRKTAIPFGPYLALGAIVAYYFQEEIIKYVL